MSSSQLGEPLECTVCHAGVKNDGFAAKGYQGHLDRFVCEACSMGFSTGLVHEAKVPSKPRNEFEVATKETFCAGCRQALIMGQEVRIRTSFFHPQCWKCNVCSKPFANEDVWDSWEDQFCHASCMPNSPAKPCIVLIDPASCSICHSAIDDGVSVVSIEGKPTHESCLRCATCQGPFENRFLPMEQPFAPRAAAPKGEIRRSGEAVEVWAEKKEGAAFEKRLLSLSATQLQWGDDKGVNRGSLKTDSFMSVEAKEAEVTLKTATKTHLFRFASKEEAATWHALLAKHV